MSWLSVTMHWLDDHSGSVQAATSTAAIAIGFGAVYFQRRSEMREAERVRSVRAQALAMRLMPEIGGLAAQLTKTPWADYSEDLAIDIPPMFASAISDLYLLKGLAPSVVELFGMLVFNQSAVKAWAGDLPSIQNSPQPYFELRTNTIDKAIAAMRELEAVAVEFRRG